MCVHEYALIPKGLPSRAQLLVLNRNRRMIQGEVELVVQLTKCIHCGFVSFRNRLLPSDHNTEVTERRTNDPVRVDERYDS